MQAGGNRRKPGQIGVWQEFCGRKPLHELLIHVQFEIRNAVSDEIDHIHQLRRYKQLRSPFQRAISKNLKFLSRQVGQHADGDRRTFRQRKIGAPPED